MFVLTAGIDAALSQGMKTKGPLPKRFSGMKRLSGILVGLLALSLIAVPAAIGAPFAYIANMGANNVSVVDGASNTVVGTVAVGRQPYGVAVNPAGTRAYVANFGDGTVSVIDTSTRTVVALVPVGSLPIGVAVNGTGSRAYVANFGSASLSVIDTTANTVVATVMLGGSPSGVAANAAGTRVYVTLGDGTVAVV